MKKVLALLLTLGIISNSFALSPRITILTNPIQYDGEERDSESGLLNLQARLLKSTGPVDVFLQQDSMDINGAGTLRYSAFGGNGVMFQDPSGHVITGIGVDSLMEISLTDDNEFLEDAHYILNKITKKIISSSSYYINKEENNALYKLITDERKRVYESLGEEAVREKPSLDQGAIYTLLRYKKPVEAARLFREYYDSMMSSRYGDCGDQAVLTGLLLEDPIFKHYKFEVYTSEVIDHHVPVISFGSRKLIVDSYIGRIAEFSELRKLYGARDFILDPRFQYFNRTLLAYAKNTPGSK